MNTSTEQITPAALHKLAALAAAQGFRSIDEFVEQSLPEPVTTVEQQEKPFYETASPDEWVKSFHEWAMSHTALPVVADDSRASIYEGCGE